MGRKSSDGRRGCGSARLFHRIDLRNALAGATKAHEPLCCGALDLHQQKLEFVDMEARVRVRAVFDERCLERPERFALALTLPTLQSNRAVLMSTHTELNAS